MESNHNFKDIEAYLVFWNDFFEEWVKDKKGTFEDFPIWSNKNRQGKGDTKLDYEVLPQPYLGDIKKHSVITLNLNPSRYSKGKENEKFEQEIKPIFDNAENYYTYAREFPTYEIDFWQKQIKWIARIFSDLDVNSENHLPFAIEICPWGSKSFQKLKIKKDDPLIKYMHHYVFDVIEKVIEHSKLKMVMSVGKAYYDIFQKSEFKRVDEISSNPFHKEVFKFSNDKYKTHLDLSPSKNNELKEKMPYNWPFKFVQRSFSIWEKAGIFYFNTYASGSNSTPGVHFDEIQNDFIKRHLQKN
tara:strand:+ start:2228 stop:3127 length:900 start_codon:yes stop_codon:yes gene_type:complete